MEHARSLRSRGRAVLFASHDLGRVAAECDRAVWLEAGAVRRLGPAGDVVAAYRERMLTATYARTPGSGDEDDVPGLSLGTTRHGSQDASIRRVALTPPADVPVGAPLAVAFTVERREPSVAACVATVSVHRREDRVKCLDASVELRLGDAPVPVTGTFGSVALTPGEYDVEVGLYAAGWSHAYDMHHGVYPLRVVGPQDGGRGIVPVRAEWSVGDG